MKKKYKEPTTGVVSLLPSRLIASSDSGVIHYCSSLCRLWHTCRDRDGSGWKKCEDFKYKD